MKIYGVILASGIGRRTGSYIPKQFIKVNGIPLIDYTISSFKKANIPVIVTVPPEYKINTLLDRYNDVIFIHGGKERIETIKKTFAVLEAVRADYVIYHDSARPLITTKDILEIKEKLINGVDVLITNKEITDSLIYKNEAVDRNNYKLIQTPEAFKVKKLIDAYKEIDLNSTIIASPLLSDPTLCLYNIDSYNFKVTHSKDIRIIEKLLSEDYSFIEDQDINYIKNKDILLFGKSGGIGTSIYSIIKNYANIENPTREEIDLSNLDWNLSKKYDYIIYAAGLCYKDNSLSFEEREKMYYVNTFSVEKLLSIAPEHVNPGGGIIIIGSSSSSTGRKDFGLYSGSKMATNAIVQSYATKLFQLGIRVNIICPTKTDTKMVQITKEEKDNDYILDPNYVAKETINALLSKEYGKIWYLYKGLDK